MGTLEVQEVEVDAPLDEVGQVEQDVVPLAMLMSGGGKREVGEGEQDIVCRGEARERVHCVVAG